MIADVLAQDPLSRCTGVAEVDEKLGITLEDAHAAVREAIGQSAHVDRMAFELHTSARRYEAAARQGKKRLSEIRHSLEELRRLAEWTLQKPNRHRVSVLRSFAEGMPEEAWVWCGSCPDEPSSQLRIALQIEGKPDKAALTRRLDFSELATQVHDIATEALEILPADRGGRPRDKAVQDLVAASSFIFEKYADIPARFAYCEDEGGKNPFTRMALKLACSVDPPIEPAKLIDYVKEHLCYGEREALAEFDETLADLVQLTDPRG